MPQYFPVNRYGVTEVYKDYLLETVFDGFGYEDENGNITWYDGYNPPEDDENHITIIAYYPLGQVIRKVY